jgi:hypothetical protein
MPGAIADFALLGAQGVWLPGSSERMEEAADVLEVSIHMSSLCSGSLFASGDVYLDQARPILYILMPYGKIPSDTITLETWW